MGELRWKLRAAGLLVLGVVVVHQLVYALAGVQADPHAHGYLAFLTPALVGLVLAGAAGIALRVLGGRRPTAEPPPRGRVLWPVLSALLLAGFVGQELVEALLDARGGHHHALRELLIGHGLWLSGPVAALIGAVLALVLRGAAAVEAWCLSITPARPAAPLSRLARAVCPPAVVRAPRDVLACHLAGRAPPLAVA